MSRRTVTIGVRGNTLPYLERLTNESLRRQKRYSRRGLCLPSSPGEQTRRG